MLRDVIGSRQMAHSSLPDPFDDLDLGSLACAASCISLALACAASPLALALSLS
jgi:hypothetical protein